MGRIPDPEAITRAVFAAPAELSHRELGDRLGIGKDTVAQIRCGMKFAHILPGIPRLDRDMGRTCCECGHFVRQRIQRAGEPERSGVCGLGLPEAAEVKFGRGCGAFTRVEA